MAKLSELKNPVYVTGTFQGSYKWSGGMSYYLNGDKNAGEIHFSIPGGNNDEFKSFHISRSINGKNAHIWYNGSGKAVSFGSFNIPNLPSAERDEWKVWIDANLASCHAAAQAFWTNAHP